jgi:hypothetical protein
MEIGLRPAEPVGRTLQAKVTAGAVCEKMAGKRPRHPVQAANAALGRQNMIEK